MNTARDRTRVRQLIFRELLEISEIWPALTMAQHMCSIMRPHKDAYQWNDELFFKKIEKYRYELETDKEDERGEED